MRHKSDPENRMLKFGEPRTSCLSHSFNDKNDGKINQHRDRDRRDGRSCLGGGTELDAKIGSAYLSSMAIRTPWGRDGHIATP